MAKILLVEDDNNLREIYEARLQAEGYDIVSARDGEEALVVAKNEHPDLVISDVMMPKISGFEMLDILRNTEGLKDVKVIMLTALGQAEDQSRADKLGADRYLVKSQVTLEDIVKVSGQLLGKTDPAAAVNPEPVNPEPAAAAQPTVAAPTPTADPTVTASPPAPETPTPDATATPIPVTAPPAAETPTAETPAATTDTQSSAQEEAAVKDQIDSFVSSQPATAPAEVAPSATTETAVTPESTTPETTPESPAATPSAAATPAPTATPEQDQVMDDAVETLVASTEQQSTPAVETAAAVDTPPADTPAPSPSPAANPSPDTSATPADSASDNGPVTIAHKKIIRPLDSSAATPAKSLDQLVAEEEAKEQVQQAGDTVIAAAEPSAASDASAAETAATGTPTPATSAPAETPDPAKPGDFDPNSIAL